ncbi:hypothetical protein [Acinetobacter sp. ANC 4218]|uniref:hypothetical protein n=1 Tax=Acinetobacter sp. ANC 4218 TaxID=1977880 RepID=UPI000A34037D|nr:hypothetical protein [Acinetobacter sp. ANC 4218]
MNNLKLHIKLSKANIVQGAYLDPAKYHNKEGLEHIPPKRRFQLSIKGSVKNLLADKDLIIFDNNKDAFTNIHQENTADSIIVNINVFDKDDNNLLADPYVDIHDKSLYIGDLNFSFEQFEFIKNMVDDQFTTLVIELVKHVTGDEILESRERNKGHVISLDYDLDNLNYSTERKEVDGEDLRVLLIKHDLNSVKVGCFSTSSSKPKYVKKGDWVDDVWSLEDRLEREEPNNEVTLLDEIDKERNNFPKHIFNELKKINSLNYVLIFLLIIVIFKI